MLGLSRVAKSIAFRGVARWCDWRPVHLRRLSPNKAFVSFTFDDFPASAVDNGAQILEANGGCGTFYASMSKYDRPRSFNRDHLSRLLERGHELGCHSHGHLHCLTASNRRILADVRRNANAIASVVNGFEFDNFAFPYGRFRPSTRRLLGRQFKSLRGIYPGIHREQVDLCVLKGNEIGRDTSPTACHELVRRVADQGGWLIFFTHEVEANPTAFGTTVGDFSNLVELATRLELEIAPIDRVIDQLGPV